MINKKLILNVDDFFEELFTLESVITITRDACLDREISAFYYDLPDSKKIVLSQERNLYINMLSLALDRVSNLKNINTKMENEIPILNKYSYDSCR